MNAWPLVLALLIGGCSSAKQEPLHAGVYSESFDFPSVQARLPELAAHHLDLYQAMMPEHLGTPALEALVRDADGRGVRVRAWLLLPRSAGYWPSEFNADPFSTALDQLLGWIEQAKLPISTVTFDLESNWDYTQAVVKIGADTNDPGRTTKLIDAFRAHIDRSAFFANREKFAQMVARVHAAGLKAHVATYPMVVDDPADGDYDLEDAFDIPVHEIDWDEVTLLDYRSTWEAFANKSFSSDLLYEYGLDVIAQFGDRGGLDFGAVGLDPITQKPGYTDPAVLYADVGAARAAGVSRLHLFSLDGAHSTPDVTPWLAFAGAPATAKPDPDPHVSQFRELFSVLDAILNPPPDGGTD